MGLANIRESRNEYMEHIVLTSLTGSDIFLFNSLVVHWKFM